MSIDTAILKEIEMLVLFSPETMREGIKVHKSAADENIDAIQRLFAKGLTTQNDGGYLTSLGIDAVEHVHNLLTILKP